MKFELHASRRLYQITPEVTGYIIVKCDLHRPSARHPRCERSERRGSSARSMAGVVLGDEDLERGGIQY